MVDIICVCLITTGDLHVQCWRINQPWCVGKNLKIISFLSNFQVSSSSVKGIVWDHLQDSRTKPVKICRTDTVFLTLKGWSQVKLWVQSVWKCLFMKWHNKYIIWCQNPMSVISVVLPSKIMKLTLAISFTTHKQSICLVITGNLWISIL